MESQFKKIRIHLTGIVSPVRGVSFSYDVWLDFSFGPNSTIIFNSVHGTVCLVGTPACGSFRTSAITNDANGNSTAITVEGDDEELDVDIKAAAESSTFFDTIRTRIINGDY